MPIIVETRPLSHRWLLLMVAIIAIVLLYWLLSTHTSSQLTEQPLATVTEPVPNHAPLAPLSSAQSDNSVPMPTSEQELLTQQSNATQAIAASAQSASTLALTATANIKDRPEYLSPMEWMMMKGVAAQHVSPETELTRMVHFVYFMKRWEYYEQLPQSASKNERRALANNLLAELPQRVRNGELGLSEARDKMQVLVADATEPRRAQENLASDSLRLLALADEDAKKASQQ